MGDGLVFVAFPLLAVRLTHDPILISGLAFASRLPWLLVALPAGAFVDRVDRRRLVLAVELFRALVVVGVAIGTVTATISLDALYAAAFLLGTGETLVSTTVRAVVPVVATGDDIAAANGHLYAAQTAGLQFAGPALGGVLFSLAASVPFLGDALSYVVSAFLLRAAIPPADPPLEARATSLTADMRDGLRWFAASPALRVLVVVVTSFAFCQAMVLAVLVLYATEVLGLSAVGYGICLAVAAVGDVGASLLARRIHARLGAYKTILFAGAGAAAGYILLSSTTVVIVAVAALALEAAASSLGNVATLSARHDAIPTERFGVVNNVFRMSVTGLVPVGALVGGLLASSIGLHATFLVAGATQLAAIAVSARPLQRLVRPKAKLLAEALPGPAGQVPG